MIIDTRDLAIIALSEFPDIVSDTILSDTNRMVILLFDGSRISIWFSLKLTGRFSFHWDRLPVAETIYRIDNTPHARWKVHASFPLHFHKGKEDDVEEITFPEKPGEQLRNFLSIVRDLVGRSER